MGNAMRCTPFLIVFAMCCWIHETSAETIPGAGDVLPAFDLTVPQRPEQRAYLGLADKGEGAFSVSDIRAELVIIEIFSMYCPYCQREAPNVNDLYDKLQKDASLSEKIKIIGIGAGNSQFEVDIFRKKYDVRFPLFPDERYAVHKCLGEVRTPYFFAVKPTGDRPRLIVYSKLGGLKDVGEFLKSITKAAGLAGER